MCFVVATQYLNGAVCDHHMACVACLPGLPGYGSPWITRLPCVASDFLSFGTFITGETRENECGKVWRPPGKTSELIMQTCNTSPALERLVACHSDRCAVQGF